MLEEDWFENLPEPLPIQEYHNQAMILLYRHYPVECCLSESVEMSNGINHFLIVPRKGISTIFDIEVTDPYNRITYLTIDFIKYTATLSIIKPFNV